MWHTILKMILTLKLSRRTCQSQVQCHCWIARKIPKPLVLFYNLKHSSYFAVWELFEHLFFPILPFYTKICRPEALFSKTRSMTQQTRETVVETSSYDMSWKRKGNAKFIRFRPVCATFRATFRFSGLRADTIAFFTKNFGG